uniref:Immunoglobulin domain protein n=1 Tax=Globodera pallida TaxID=36090 RepID=A0A183BX01_GLOPA
MSEKTSAQHIVWYRDGQPLERHSSQLSIPSIASSDAGLYRCYVSNAFGGAFSPAVNVSVNYFHGFGDEPDSFFDRRVVLNSPINLRPPSLKIGGYMSNLHWAWFKDGQKLNSDDRRYFLSYSGELVVLRADDLAMGIYRVEVHRNLTPVFRARDYRVVAEPSSLPIEPSFDIIYRPRDVKVVIMHANKGNPPTMAIFECVPNLRNALETEIRWLLNSEQLSDSTGHVRFELGGQRLRILDVAQLLVGLAAHSVAIQCKVRIRTVDGAHWMDQADARLDILEKPRLLRPSLAPVVVEKREGDPLQLECHAERAWPRANFSWYFNDQKLENAGAERLVISNLSVNHFGAYQCEATNTAGTDIVPIWVVRHEDANHSPRKTPTFSTNRPTPAEDSQSPIIIQGPQNQSLLIGSKAQLPCQIAPGNDGLRAFWFINNEQIPSAGGDPFHRIFVDANGTLWINQVGPDNTGEYRCTARTTVGGGVERARQTAWLSIIEKPGMVQNVRAELTNSTGQERILVHWTPGFDGNSPVVKWSVEMRTKPTGQLTVFWSDWELAIELFSPTKLVASSDCCATFVENVRPAATAEFRVIAHNKFGVGKPSVPSQNVKMPQRPPTAVPTKVHASARSSQSVMVQWQPPEHGETNEESDIRGYLVRYRLSGYSTADWNDRNVSDGLARNVLIEPLITWREYDVQVAAYNDRGLGVFSRPVTVTTLEGLPLQAPQNVHVKAKHIQRELGEIRQLKKALEEEQQKATEMQHYAEIARRAFKMRHRAKQIGIRKCPWSKPSFGTLEAFSYIVFSSRSSTAKALGRNDIGHANFAGLDAADRLATLSPQTEVERAFEKLKMAQFVIPGGAKTHQYQLSGLRPFSLYQFRILSRNRVGQSRPGDVVNATTFEGVPSVAPALRAKLNAQGGIEVHWDQLELDQANGLIVAYKVRLRADDGELLEREVSSSEARTVVNFPSTTLRPYTKYAVTVSTGTVVGEGPVQERPIMLETPQDVTDPPTNVSFVYKSPTELRLGWTTPSHPNGQILHYGVLMWRNDEQRPAIPFTEVPANLNQFMATQLLPETVYNFALNAQTAVGWGAERVLRVRTGKQSAPLPIPPVPQRDTSTAQSSTALHLIWDPLDNTNSSSSSSNNVDESNSPARAIELAWQKTNHQPQHEWITVDECIPVERHRHTVKRCS